MPPKRIEELSPAAVRNLTKPGMNAVGGCTGLYLQISGRGKSWVLRIKIGTRRRDIGLGSYPTVGLSEARDKARAMREQVAMGIDPIEQRQAAQQALRDAQAAHITFEQAARRKYAVVAPQFRNKSSRNRWIRTLEIHAFPKIGYIPVADIRLDHVYGVLKPIWTKMPDTAKRLRQNIESTLAWAKVSGYRDSDNVAVWQGNLSEMLPRQTKRVKHHAALAYADMPAFMQRLGQRSGISARALEFAILCASRSGEVRYATWDEFDLGANIWRLPPERMKANRAHVVPLTPQARAILDAVPKMKANSYVFPAPRGGALSDMALSAITKRMAIDAVPHGFRATFKDFCRETQTAMPDEISELCLAHGDPDKTRGAYTRSKLIDLRAQLLRAWADYCIPVKKSEKIADISQAIKTTG